MDWCRLWSDLPTDPKWRVIARRSGRPVAEVISVFVMMLSNATRSSARGELDGWDDEDAAMALDLEPETVAAIRSAMQGKVLDGNALTGWERRQPKREDDGSAQRKRRQRDREQKERDEERVTQCHAPSRGVTTEESRGEESNSRRDAAASPESPKDYVWRVGVDLLTSAGEGERNARSFLGRLCKNHGDEAVREAVGRAVAVAPAEPKAWLQGAVKSQTSEPFLGDT